MKRPGCSCQKISGLKHGMASTTDQWYDSVSTCMDTRRPAFTGNSIARMPSCNAGSSPSMDGNAFTNTIRKHFSFQFTWDDFKMAGDKKQLQIMWKLKIKESSIFGISAISKQFA